MPEFIEGTLFELEKGIEKKAFSCLKDKDSYKSFNLSNKEFFFLLNKYTVIKTLSLLCFISDLLTSILFKDNLLYLLCTNLNFFPLGLLANAFIVKKLLIILLTILSTAGIFFKKF